MNPQTGDTFAWTVDLNNQDQGLWQDQCVTSGGACSNPTITFAKQWNTAALETNTLQGAATILDGDYNLTLSTVPSEQDTLVLAGAIDLWKCSLAMGCVWRNTTNSTTCMSARVAEYQHSLAWNAANPLEIFLGNDGGLWRSTDAIGETGSPCAATDSTHFQNLNGSLGSLDEVVSLSPVITSQYSLMAGLGVNGIAGVKKFCRNRGLAADSLRPRRPCGHRPQQMDRLVREQPGRSRHLSVLAARSLHARFVRHKPGGHRRGRWRRR